MTQHNDTIEYFLYARKSSESEDRQVQSIEDQLGALKALAAASGLRIKEVYTESKSAKKPENRPLFDEMMKRIENGDAQGILCWQINRLSRNPIESGRLSWLLQQGVLKTIQTADRQYLPDDNVLLFSVETGMANQFILDLRKNVRRGMNSKLEKGRWPGMAPLGYLNDKAEKTIVKDPKRFPLVRKMWDLMLTGVYSPPQILEIANNEWGFRTRKTRKTGGKELSTSGIYRIFANPFYAGSMVYFGKQYPGKHDRMITFEEYDRVQALLGRKGKAKTEKHTFAFTGCIRCGECGCLVTAERKKKFIKSTGKIRYYVYYHCTRKKKEVACSQRRVITEEELTTQIEEQLERITILPRFRDWAIENLKAKRESSTSYRKAISEVQVGSLEQAQTELDNLTRMRYRDLIDDAQFIKERDILQAKTRRLNEKIERSDERVEERLVLTEKTFNFAAYARSAFISGSQNTKKEIFIALSQNSVLKDRKLTVHLHDWLRPLATAYPPLRREFERLEPEKTPMNTRRKEAFAALLPRVCTLVNKIVTIMQQIDTHVHIPDISQEGHELN